MDKIAEGFSQYCQGAKGELHLYSAYRAGYLRCMADTADIAENVSTSPELSDEASGALLSLASVVRLTRDGLA